MNDEANVINRNTLVPIGMAVAVAAGLVGGAWRISSGMSSLEARVDNLGLRVELGDKSQDERLDRVEKAIDALTREFQEYRDDR